jgi:uncharacterized membrane protein YjjP (DUF1212 family)
VREIVSMSPRFGRPVTILGHVVLTVGICLVLQPTWGDLVLAALFGALVAVLKLAGGRWTSIQMIMPVTAAFAVSSITLALDGRRLLVEARPGSKRDGGYADPSRAAPSG